MASLTFTFEELPLVVADGFEAGLVNGQAEIIFQPDGEFSISSISLDGYKRRSVNDVMRDCFRNIASDGAASSVPPMFENKSVELERGSWLFNAIHDQLENGSFKKHVEIAVSAELEAEGVVRVDFNREHRLSSREVA